MRSGPDGLGDRDDAALDQPTQHNLADGLLVRGRDGRQQGVAEQAIATFCERCPVFNLNPVLAHQLLVCEAGAGPPQGDLVAQDEVDRRSPWKFDTPIAFT